MWWRKEVRLPGLCMGALLRLEKHRRTVKTASLSLYLPVPSSPSHLLAEDAVSRPFILLLPFLH